MVAQSSSFGFAFARTKADGTYTAKKVSPGSYQVEFIPGGVFSNCGNKGNYLPAAQSVTVASQATSTADAVLPTGGVISGVVSDPHGKPLAGVCVFSSSPYGGLSVTRSDGSYRLRQLFSGSYFVGFEGGCGNQQSVAPQAYRGDPTFLGPASISVTAGQVTTGIDAAMKPGVTIAGHVTDQAGKPVSAVCVLILGVTGAGGFGDFGASVIDHGGRYSAANLPPGQYNVLFTGLFARHRGCGRSPYADQQFSGAGFGARPNLISAAAGKITTGVNAALTLAGKISGVVSGQGGQRHPGYLRDRDRSAHGNDGRELQRLEGPVHADRPPGRPLPGRVLRQLRRLLLLRRDQPELREPVVQGSGHSGRGRHGRRPGRPDHPEHRRGDDAWRNDQRPGHLQAQSATGELRLRLRLHVERRQHHAVGLTDRRGRYSIDGLSTGRYVLEFEPCIGGTALATQVKAGRVHVVAGHVVRSVNEQLVLGGSISGTTSAILPGGSKPAPGTCIDVLPLSPTAGGSVTFSLQGGSFTATNLAPGRYVAPSR